MGNEWTWSDWTGQQLMELQYSDLRQHLGDSIDDLAAGQMEAGNKLQSHHSALRASCRGIFFVCCVLWLDIEYVESVWSWPMVGAMGQRVSGRPFVLTAGVPLESPGAQRD